MQIKKIFKYLKKKLIPFVLHKFQRQTFIQNQEHNQNFQVFDQVIDFVDSPPDSKEAWSPDYVKGKKKSFIYY